MRDHKLYTLKRAIPTVRSDTVYGVIRRLRLKIIAILLAPLFLTTELVYLSYSKMLCHSDCVMIPTLSLSGLTGQSKLSDFIKVLDSRWSLPPSECGGGNDITGQLQNLRPQMSFSNRGDGERIEMGYRPITIEEKEQALERYAIMSEEEFSLPIKLATKGEGVLEEGAIFHGTNTYFKEFILDSKYSWTLGRGAYFTDNYEQAHSYALVRTANNTYSKLRVVTASLIRTNLLDCRDGLPYDIADAWFKYVYSQEGSWLNSKLRYCILVYIDYCKKNKLPILLRPYGTTFKKAGIDGVLISIMHGFENSFSDFMLSLGYDGIIYDEGGENTGETEVGNHVSIVIFDPMNIITYDMVKGFKASIEPIKQGIEQVLNKVDFTPEELLRTLEDIPLVKDWLTSDKPICEEGYTLKSHTLMVMQQFEKYFAKRDLPASFDNSLFRLILALHDIGKLSTLDKGGSQHAHTQEMIRKIGEYLPFNQKQVDFIIEIIGKDKISSDPIGLYIRNLTRLFHKLQEIGIRTGL